MSVRLDSGIIILEGDCPVDEAESLLELLLANPGASVDWSACGQLHTAVVQVLLAARPPMEGEPGTPFLRRWIAPIVNHL
jgi:hypothetical protein